MVQLQEQHPIKNLPTIRVANTDDIDGIVQIHQEAFPGFFLTRLGPAFLCAYYQLVQTYEHNIVLVATNGTELTGFVSGFLYPEQFYRRMSAAKRRLLWPVVRGVCAQPSCLPQVLNNSKRVAMPTSELHAKFSGIPCELSSIGVLPTCKGKGHGKALLSAFSAHAVAQKAGYIHLTTDAENNDVVNRFYQQMGFDLIATFASYRKRLMNQYCQVLTGLELKDVTL